MKKPLINSKIIDNDINEIINEEQKEENNEEDDEEKIKEDLIKLFNEIKIEIPGSKKKEIKKQNEELKKLEEDFIKNFEKNYVNMGGSIFKSNDLSNQLTIQLNNQIKQNNQLKFNQTDQFLKKFIQHEINSNNIFDLTIEELNYFFPIYGDRIKIRNYIKNKKNLN